MQHWNLFIKCWNSSTASTFVRAILVFLRRWPRRLWSGRAGRSTIDPLIATGVVVATAATDAVYVMFTSAVVARHRVSAATWSSIWYLLSSFAVIHYTENWLYVAFAAAGSWIGAFASLSFLHRPARPLQ